jgi:hypothetical protein
MDQESINKLINGFDNNNPRNIYVFNEKVSPCFKQLICDIHHEALPSDFIHEIVYHCLGALKEWGIKDQGQFDEFQGDMIDAYLMPIDYRSQRAHFNEFPEYAEDAKIDNLPENATIQDCLAMGCYLHISEILNTVWEFLKQESGKLK